MPHRIAADVGGTFTDLVLVDDDGLVTEAKTPSNATNPDVAMRAGLELLAERTGRTLAALMANCSLLIHGTTVAVNTLIQLRGAKTGLICTDGFRDTLEIRLGYRDVRYPFSSPPPPILVPRRLRIPVRERINKLGKVAKPIDLDDVASAIAILKQEEVDAVAICLLWSFANPAHENVVARMVREAMPETYVSVSSEVSPQIREYDRTSTTVLNAYLGPTVISYLARTENILRSLGFEGAIRYVQSNGGLADARSLRRKPVLALNSGPAAAPAAGLFFGRRLKRDRLITMDMGGTSLDACLIDRGVPEVATSADVHRYRLAVPLINVKTIGAGGGSIAWLDNGMLRVGPQSAEADPGPACYMRGGTAATVTDADVVLGYLNPKSLLGGTFPIDAQLAREAIREKIALPLGLTIEDAARGIVEVVNRNMADAISEISLERGYDPREFTLVAAGGQGGIHACALARELSLSYILIPRFAGTFCAFGALVSDLRHDFRTTFATMLGELRSEALEATFQALERAGLEELRVEGAAAEAVLLKRQLDMRYSGQVYEVTVDVTGLALDESSQMTLLELLHKQHEREFTYRLDEGLGEIINAGVTAVGSLPSIQLPPIRSASTGRLPDPAGGRRRAILPNGTPCEMPVFEGLQLDVGSVIVGPAIVEEPHTTILVLPRFEMTLTSVGAYLMRSTEATA